MQHDPRAWDEPAPYSYLELRNIELRLRWEWLWRCRIHCADTRGLGPFLDDHYERKRKVARQWLQRAATLAQWQNRPPPENVLQFKGRTK